MELQDYREDPDWLLARAVYFFPDGDIPDQRLMIRFDAVREMRDIEARIEAATSAACARTSRGRRT